MRKTPVFFLVLMLGASGILLAAADYGESSAFLGQFTDEFDSSDYVSVTEDIIRNTTYNAMELNQSERGAQSENVFQLREHKFYAAYSVDYSYSIQDGDQVSQDSTSAALGKSYQFVVCDRVYLDGKYLRFRWRQYTTSSTSIGFGYLYDGTYDRSSDVHFPAGSAFITFGNGLLQNLGQVPTSGGWGEWTIVDVLIDSSGGSETNVTIFWETIDQWNSQDTGLQLEWIEINTGAGGTGNIATYDFNMDTNIVMENTGTQGDYGYVNNTGLLVMSGGYKSAGYFSTTDYLDEANGSTLVQLVNTTIPASTGILIEFSSDNSIWINATNLKDGFQAIDLRALNWSSSCYLRYNFTSNDAMLTPRLYQSRLITTFGGEAGTVTVIEPDFPWIAIAIILMCVAYLLLGPK